MTQPAMTMEFSAEMLADAVKLFLEKEGMQNPVVTTLQLDTLPKFSVELSGSTKD